MFNWFNNLFGLGTEMPSTQVMTQTHVPGVGTTTEMTDSSGLSTPVAFEADISSSWSSGGGGGDIGGGMGGGW